MTDMTLNEFFVARDSAFKEVLHAEPGEELLKVFAKYEHQGNDRRIDIQSEITLKLCFMLTRNRIGREIIEMRADCEAVRKRYDEIKNSYGPRMFWSVVEMVGWRSPPLCFVCNSEEDRGPDDPFETYSVDSLGPDRVHKSCLDKFNSWADDAGKSSGIIPPIEVLDAAWREKHSA
jgi:hypothetical protein